MKSMRGANNVNTSQLKKKKKNINMHFTEGISQTPKLKRVNRAFLR